MRKYVKDPVKVWKESIKTADPDGEEEPDSQDFEKVKGEKGSDFDYLLVMPMWNLTQEEIGEICWKRDDKKQELKNRRATTKEEQWEHDHNELLKKLDSVEEAKDGNGGAGGGTVKSAKGGKGFVSQLPVLHLPPVQIWPSPTSTTRHPQRRRRRQGPVAGKDWGRR